MAQSTVQTCSACAGGFRLGYTPSPGKPVLCADCTIHQTNFSDHPLTLALQAFLAQEIKKNITVKYQEGKYWFIAMRKPLCSLAFAAKSKDALTPQIIPIATLHPEESSSIEPLAKFVKGGKRNGVEISIM